MESEYVSSLNNYVKPFEICHQHQSQSLSLKRYFDVWFINGTFSKRSTSLVLSTVSKAFS
jgi:hypothetical protein